jgi:mono/diheme cytochrome c family protein
MSKFRFARPLVAALALMTLGGCKPLDDVAVLIFGRSMRDQRSFDPYENPRGAPENSVAFASGNYPAAPGEVNLGQPEGVDVPRFTQLDLGVPGEGNEVIQGLVNPMDPSDAVSMARGEEIYMRFCVVCHGPDGVGTNAYIADKHPLLPAYNLSGETVAAYSDQYIYAIIRVGRGLMPEYGSRITHFDRWSVVNYVRQLQVQAGNTPAGGDE